ncbi:ATP-grasp domain-containing protein [Humitalea sp. 24SJ18S-53]|uniref:ATP-grasp domain-containing protein n=1 Tax=Humitalea sp. 24SJ18S-53 TaxID=3422307 RepID=UPI003D6717E2
MRLTEHEGKALLRRHGIAVPHGSLISATDPAPDWPGTGVAKAQVLEGGRGKRGLVRVFGAGDCADAVAAVRASGAGHVPLLIEEALPIQREIYLSLRVDGTAQTIALLASAEGGVEIEQGPPPLAIGFSTRDPHAASVILAGLRQGFPTDLAVKIARLVRRLATVMIAEDLELLEINPLALLPDGRLVAADARIMRDDAAGLRHDAADTATSVVLEAAARTPLEQRAAAMGFSFVELAGGSVALVSAGAGLGMMLVDLLADAGAPAACFMDNAHGGPAETSAERLAIAYELAARPEVRAILFCTVLASRPLRGRVDALAEALRLSPPPKPLVVAIAAGHTALAGYSMAEAAARLAAVGVVALHDDPVAAVAAVARLAA